ncbi:MAG: hypothetical protein HC902_04500 [Calothrix sp. SM1_5_4]|nr:hypothetical protein [Calothrix sp. SM1_5_4]
MGCKSEDSRDGATITDITDSRPSTALPPPQESETKAGTGPTRTTHIAPPPHAVKPAEQPKAKPDELKPAKTVIQVSVSEDIIQKLENNWSDLPNSAEARKEARGWRIVRLGSASPLSLTGLREGDLVTADFLADLSQQGQDGVNLALRMEQILNRISR